MTEIMKTGPGKVTEILFGQQNQPPVLMTEIMNSPIYEILIESRPRCAAAFKKDFI